MIKQITLTILCSGLLFLAGCNTLPSAENEFDHSTTDEKEVVSQKPTITLDEAIEYTQSDLLERFWFRAHIANNIEKRRITHMTINGIVVRPHGYYMNNSLITNPYEYYRWDDEVYIRYQERWFRAREPELPFDPFYGFTEWEPYLDRAKLVRPDNVLGVPTNVYEIELTGEELLQLETPFMERLQLDELENLSPILKETTLKVYFYVGDVDNEHFQNEIFPVIYKYQTLIQMPIPGAGFMEQEVQYFIFRINDESVEMTPIEEIEKNVTDNEEYQTLMLDHFDEVINLLPQSK